MQYEKLEISTGVDPMNPVGDVTVETDVHFHLRDNSATWSSTDFDRTGSIDNAKVSIGGPNHQTGKMSLIVEGWVPDSATRKTATYQRWSLELA